MLTQRGADLTRESRKQEAEKPAKAAAPAAKLRMTFKDKHALETLPKTIATRQASAEALQAKLADPQFYARDRAGFEKLTSTLAELQRKIAAAEEQWLELEVLREELPGS